MILDFKSARRLVEAVQRVLDAVHGNRPIDRDDAGDLCLAAKAVLGLYEATDHTRADLGMLDILDGVAARARSEGDATLAADLEDCAARLRVHVARGIASRLSGEKLEPATPLELQLRASVEANEAKKAAAFTAPILRGTPEAYKKKAEPIAPRLHPSDVVVSLHGKGA